MKKIGQSFWDCCPNPLLIFKTGYQSYLSKLFRKKMNHNALCSTIVEKSSPSAERKIHKMGMSFSIEDLSL